MNHSSTNKNGNPRMTSNRLFLLFFIIMASPALYNCAILQRTKVHWVSNVEDVRSPSEKIGSIKKIGINRFSARPANLGGFTAENFTNNLRFFLIREGLDTAIQEIQHETPKAAAAAESAPVTGSPPQNVNLLGYGNLANGTTGLVGESGEKPMEPSKENIQKACNAASCNVYIDGYIYEKKTGNILDETVTTGIFVRIYNSSGIMVAQIKLSSGVTMEIFDNNAVIAEMAAERIRSLLNKDTRSSSFNWKFWE
ncbi:lipoprotein [Leptospira yasudae]|uniref:Lipoprotein n=2 Tax=Leptospira yasudae TaxID=2202201 RepID=A0ABX9M9C0_9LEPT|nr:lipoprotein [Leptospira yasudae]